MNWLTSIDFENALHGCIGVIHLGAELSDVSKMDQVNVRATEALAAAAEQSTSIASFVFASSISVYGTPGSRLVTENARTIPTGRDVCSEYWAEPFIRQYARTKVSGERALSTVLRGLATNGHCRRSGHPQNLGVEQNASVVAMYGLYSLFPVRSASRENAAEIGIAQIVFR